MRATEAAVKSMLTAFLGRISELHANLFSRLRVSRWFKISSMPLKARSRIGYVKKRLGFRLYYRLG